MNSFRREESLDRRLRFRNPKRCSAADRDTASDKDIH
jgi:hypothetical protein